MSREMRRAQRRSVDDTVMVVDTMTDAPIGRLGNLSETGMLVMAHARLPADALFQLRFDLAGDGGREACIEVGAHLLWQEPAGASGQCWSGFRFITVPEPCRRLLRDWVQAPGAAPG